jgi:hypothetical protein
MKVRVRHWEPNATPLESVFERGDSGEWLCRDPGEALLSFSSAVDVSHLGAVAISSLEGELDPWVIAAQLPSSIWTLHQDHREVSTADPRIDGLPSDASPVVVIGDQYWMPFAGEGDRVTWLPVVQPEWWGGEFAGSRLLASASSESGSMTSGMWTWHLYDLAHEHICVVVQPDDDPMIVSHELRDGRTDDEIIQHFIDSFDTSDWPTIRLALLEARANGGSWEGEAYDLAPELDSPAGVTAVIHVAIGKS